MENPGLKRHISDQRASYLKVTSRRTATTNPPMPAPHTKTIDGYQTGIEDTYGTQRENVTTPPPLMGGSGQMPVPATNGEYGQDRTPNLEHLEVWGGAGVTLVPGETRQKGNPTAAQPLEQMSDPNPAADERRKQMQQQVGGGEKENPAYDRAQDQIRERLQLRRAHPLHQAASQDDEWWGRQPDIEDTGIYSDYFFPGSIHQHGPSCETCYLKDGLEGVDRRYHDAEARNSAEPDHPFKPLEMESGQRFSGVRHQAEIEYLGRPEGDDDGLRYFVDTDFMPDRVTSTMQPMINLKKIHDQEQSDPYEADWDSSSMVSGSGRPQCETCYLERGVAGVPPEAHGSLMGHSFKPLEMQSGQRFSAWDPEREQFLYRIDNGPNYYLNDAPPSRNSPTNQSMFDLKQIFDGSDEESPDLLDDSYTHPGFPACRGCENADMSSQHPDSRIHQPGQSRDERAHKYQPVEDLPSGVRLAALVDNTSERDREFGLRTFHDTDFLPSESDGPTNQPMISFKRSEPDPYDEDLSVDDPAYHSPSEGESCETCWLRDDDQFSTRKDHNRGDLYDHPFKPLRMEPGQRFSAYDHVRQEWLYDIDKPNYFEEDRAPSSMHHTRQDLFSLKENHPDYRVGEDIDEEGKIAPYGEQWDPAELYSETQYSRDKRDQLAREGANQGSPEDPIYPFKGWGNGEPEDTVDEHNLQEGDDSFRPHHPLVDRAINHLQGFPDMSRSHPLMEGVNRILDEGPEEGSDALAGGLNTIFDSMRETEGMSPEERLQHAKDAIDLHIETGKLTHKEHVKRLREDWEARGGRKTGEPVPVEHFSPRYTHPDGQYIVPDPNNPFPQSTSVIRPKGKCKGCGRQTFMDDAHDMSDPRGPIGDAVSDPMRAADYDMHGPDLPACFDCQNDYGRYNRILDKGKGHKAGEPSGGFHWEWQRQPDGTQRNVRVDYTHYKDKKGFWHHPGEQAGSCPDCGPNTPPDLRTAHHEPLQDIKDTIAIQGSPGNWDWDEYMHGMFNGMELQNSIIEGREPQFRNAPGMWGRERAALRQKQNPISRDSVMPKAAGLKKRGESDEEFWARMEREHPGQQNTNRLLHSPDQAGMEFDDEGENYRDPELEWDDDDLDTPENMSLRDHARLLRSGVFRWDGNTRYPKYTHEIHREIRDSEGNRAHAIEGQVIEHNSHHRGPVLPTSDNPDPHPLEYPWQHTYYPAGVRDEEGLVRGYNSPDDAIAASHQLALWGPRHHNSQDLLKGYRYNYSEMPYDSSVELPHEKAMRREAGFKEQWKDAFGDLIDHTRGWNADFYDVLRMHDQLKALGDPDFFDEHGNLIHKGAEPRVRPARPITIREMVKKPREPRKPQPQFPEQHLIDPGRPLANPGRTREPRPLANPGRSRVAAWDDNRGEFLYDIDRPDYWYMDSPPSRGSNSAQEMVKEKDLPYVQYDDLDWTVNQPGDDDKNYLYDLDSPHNHPNYPACETCIDRGIDPPHHPRSYIHKDSHPFKPIEDLAPGVRLANA